MADTVPFLSYSKLWTNRDDFPTVEVSEDKVRADFQELPDEAKEFINNEIVPVLNQLLEDVENLRNAVVSLSQAPDISPL